jgi:5-methylcytosine-specific restriction endonuclease McrA
VHKRDNGICQICKIDIEQQEQSFEALWKIRKQELQALKISPYGREHFAEKTRLQEQFCFARGRWSEVDHEIPVVEGGGLCPPEQLRLVCGRCHANVTAELQGRLAAKNTTRKPKKKANAK